MRFYLKFIMTLFFVFPSVNAFAFSTFLYNLTIQNQKVHILYRDIQPLHPNGKTVVLLHGKNFTGAYWEKTIIQLQSDGYRVVVPDILGFGQSSRPIISYSFQLLSYATFLLLQHIHVGPVDLVGHSMGGMIAIRFALMYPKIVDKLILEDPLGLEDYRLSIPYQTIDEQYEHILKQSPEQIKDYQKQYFTHWNKDYQQWTASQLADQKSKNKKQLAFVSALLYDIIYTQPVVYELDELKMPTLIIVGENDRTAPGKAYAPPDVRSLLGQIPLLANKAGQRIPQSKVIIVPDVGHIPHLENFPVFISDVEQFMRSVKPPSY